jgi:threonine 3-dehydrogenase
MIALDKGTGHNMHDVIPETQVIPKFIGDGRITMHEGPVPAAGESEVLLRVAGNVLCGSERYQFFSGSSVTPGHEVSGEIVAVGAGVEHSIGTHGAVFLMQFCGACRSCRTSATNQCLDKHGDVGFTRDGGYQPYIAVSASSFFPTPQIDPVDAPILLDIMGTGGHAIDRARLVHDDIERIVVVGAGPIGLAVLAMAKLIFGHEFPVAISDIAPYRLRLAEQLGGIPIDVSSQSLAEGLAAIAFGVPDAAFDTSGRTEVREHALDTLAQRGVLVCVGHGGAIVVKVSRQLIASERAILGSEYFRFDEFPRNLALLQQHRDYLTQIITHEFPQSDLEEAMTLFFAGNAGKVLIRHTT